MSEETTPRDNSQNPEPPTPERNTKDKRQLLLILAVFFLPFIILPMVMSPETMEKTNKGILIVPHLSVTGLQLEDERGNPYQLPEKKWTMMYFFPADCNKACRNSLFAMRQSRLALDKDMSRVKHLLVHTADRIDPNVASLLSAEFSMMDTVRGNADVINGQFTSILEGVNAAEAGNIYLMSPDGYIFMYYPSYEDEQESVLRSRDIRYDLKKSLKGSRIG
jgi:cytochrome oxidase Cu insertion factor (SCO1/SenC/PrrC family)